MDQSVAIKTFFANLNGLKSGQRAALKRSAGVMLSGADARALAAFYRALPPDVFTSEEPKWFAAACFACMWDPAENFGRPMEQLLGELIRMDDLSDSMQHRVEILMDMEWNADGYMLTKLSRMVKMLRQKILEVPDFAELLSDLRCWNYEDQRIQKKWARAIFGSEE